MNASTKQPEPARSFPAVWTWSAIAGIVAITVLHYGTHGGVGNIDTHTLFRRMYYLPIAMLAVIHGLKGAWSGVVVAILYIPHAFLGNASHRLGVHLHADPAPTVEKLADVVLYIAIGILVGLAVDRARHAQEAVASLEDGLQRAARLSALGELVAGVAHEIRNPLASLQASAEVFVEEFRDDKGNARLAELNLAEVQRLSEIVNRFLEYARPSPPKRAALSAADLLDRVAALTSSTAKERNVSVEVTATDAVVQADRDQLVQVLLNLVLNAIESSSQKGRIRLSFKADEAACVFAVDDDGPGIPTDAEEKVFDPFFTTRAEGTGLGLSVVQQLVDGHGGSVKVSSSDLGGARFTVHLPNTASEADA